MFTARLPGSGGEGAQAAGGSRERTSGPIRTANFDPNGLDHARGWLSLRSWVQEAG